MVCQFHGFTYDDCNAITLGLDIFRVFDSLNYFGKIEA